MYVCFCTRTLRHKSVIVQFGLFFLSVTSWHTLLERPQSNASVLERLPSSTPRKDRCLMVSDPIQRLWATCNWQVGYSPFPIWWRLANRSSNCIVMVIIRSTACNVQPKNLKRRSIAMLESGVSLTLPWLLTSCYMMSVMEPQNPAESPCIKCVCPGTQVPCCGPSFIPVHQYWNYICLTQPIPLQLPISSFIKI